MFAFAVAARADGVRTQSSDGVQFVRVWPGWRSEESTTRIYQYFGGASADADRHLLLTRPERRAGYYFLVRVKHQQTPLTGGKFRLQVVTPEAPEPKTFAFPADAGPGTDVFELGLTGADWPGPNVHPVAWRLDLVSPGGELLASSQSFLWSKPAQHP